MCYRGDVEFRFKQTPTKIIYGELSFDNGKIYEVGDKIGQLIIIPIPEITLVETDELTETDRGEGGFGSTDSK